MEHTTTKSVSTALQANLEDYLVLGLQTKNAHWNIVGPRFLEIHEFLDDVYASAQTFADETAERIRALKSTANGNLDVLVADPLLPPMPTGEIFDADVVSLILHRLELIVEAVRTRLDKIEDKDVVTADLIHAQLLALEKHAWMLRSTAVVA